MSILLLLSKCFYCSFRKWNAEKTNEFPNSFKLQLTCTFGILTGYIGIISRLFPNWDQSKDKHGLNEKQQGYSSAPSTNKTF